MKALVTGAGGFLGFHVAQSLLKEGHQVVTISRNLHGKLKQLGTRNLQGDIAEYTQIVSAFENVDCVFHIAAKVGIWGKWKDFYRTNVVGTKNVVRACHTQGVKRLVFTSSPSVVFAGDSQRDLNESTPYANRWLNHYSHSKMLAEQFVLQSNNNRSLFTIALRPHLIWGNDDPHLIERVCTRGKSGLLVRVGDGRNKVDIIHVLNASFAHLLAAKAIGPDRPGNGKAYFLSQGEPVNLWSFIDDVLKQRGIASIKKRLPYPVAYSLGGIFELIYRALKQKNEPRITRFVAQQLAKDHFYDISAAKRDLGYKPLISTQEGLEALSARN